jgi:phosphate-selective porin OprO/OprP
VPRPADTGGPDTAVGAVRYGVTFQERPELRVDGTRLISTGAINTDTASTAGLELAGQWRNVFVQSELEKFQIERLNAAPGVSDPDFGGWYIEGSWIVTGERRRYNMNSFAFDAPPVDHPFDPHLGSWGAIELAGRYSVSDLNYAEGALGTAPSASAVRGGEQTITTGGVNWYLNSAVRFMLDYSHVKIDRLSPNAATFQTPVGAQIGQTYDVVSLRSQFAF